MKLVEIAGHLIDPGKVSYVGPLGNPDGTRAPDVWFSVVVDGAKAIWRFGMPMVARNARRDLAIAAVRSAQPEMTELEAGPRCVSWGLMGDGTVKPCVPYCVSWHKHEKDEIAPFPSDPPFSDYKPSDTLPSDNGATGVSDALVGIESDDQIPLSCPFDCNEDIPNLACCRLCVATGMRTPRRA